MFSILERPLPVSPPEKNALREISEPSSDSTTSDVSEIVDDSSDDSSDDSDDKEETKKLNGGQTCFDANSNLPPVPVPNGTLDLTSPDKQKFSSDEERYDRVADFNTNLTFDSTKQNFYSLFQVTIVKRKQQSKCYDQ